MMVCVLVAELARHHTHDALPFCEQGLRGCVLLKINACLQKHFTVAVEQLNSPEQGILLVIPKDYLANILRIRNLLEIGRPVSFKGAHTVLPKQEIVLRVSLVVHDSSQVVAHPNISLDRELSVLLFVELEVGCRHPEDVDLQQGLI